MYRPRHSELMPSDNARGIVGGEGRFWANCRLVFTDEHLGNVVPGGSRGTGSYPGANVPEVPESDL